MADRLHVGDRMAVYEPSWVVVVGITRTQVVLRREPMSGGPDIYPDEDDPESIDPILPVI